MLIKFIFAFTFKASKFMLTTFLACSVSLVLKFITLLNTKIEPNLDGSIKNNFDGGTVLLRSH